MTVGLGIPAGRLPMTPKDVSRRILLVNKRTVLAGLCLSSLCVILVAALSPFTRHPANEVTWTGKENGLYFGDYGTVLSSADFAPAGHQTERACSLAILLQPAETFDSSVIIAFSTQESPRQFRIGQANDAMFVSRTIPAGRNRGKTSGILVEHAFRRGQQLLITVTSDGQAASIYLNDRSVKASRHFGLSSQDFSGQLVLGNSPVRHESWSGYLKGVVFYDRELTAAEVSGEYRDWIQKGRVETVKEKRVVALYLFNEHAGKVVHNQVRARPDLYIPDHFVTLHQAFLTLPWEEYSADWGYLRGILKNILGFVPFGFLFCAYLSVTQLRPRAIVATILLGALISLSIEIVQAYLPSRESGMTDIITNTLGTTLGAFGSICRPAASLLAKLRRPE